MSLVEAIDKLLEFMPENDPDPIKTPPHEFFSGGGASYLETLIDFVGSGRFFMEVTSPGTEFRFESPMSCRPRT